MTNIRTMSIFLNDSNYSASLCGVLAVRRDMHLGSFLVVLSGAFIIHDSHLVRKIRTVESLFIYKTNLRKLSEREKNEAMCTIII